MALLMIGFFVLLIGLVADILASVRRLLEDVLYRQRLLEEELDQRRAASSAEAERVEQTR
jgi:hypothetical protein